MAKPGDKGCKLPLKASAEEKEVIQEVTTSLAAAREINEDAGVVAVSSELMMFALYY